MGKAPTFSRESSHVPIPDFLMISNDARRCEPFSKFRHSSHFRIPNFLMMQKGASPSVNLGIGLEPLSDLGHPDFLMMEKVRSISDLHFFTGSLHPPYTPPTNSRSLLVVEKFSASATVPTLSGKRLVDLGIVPICCKPHLSHVITTIGVDTQGRHH